MWSPQGEGSIELGEEGWGLNSGTLPFGTAIFLSFFLSFLKNILAEYFSMWDLSSLTRD